MIYFKEREIYLDIFRKQASKAMMMTCRISAERYTQIQKIFFYDYNE